MLAVERNRGLIRMSIQAALGIASYSLMILPALAQQAGAPQAGAPQRQELEEVIVTGFRGSLEKALDDKRASAAAIDSIRAEDIAKFPDSNLAESVQRIPGVSIARDAGEGRNLTVRGLGPQFTRVRINGMEAMSTTGGTDSSGGANRNRSFDFNVFASELFNSITARKTASADVEEGSLGATVDLQTARPFDFPGFKMVAAAKGAYNDLSDDFDPRASFLISDTFADGRFGALFSAAYTQRRLLEEGTGTVRWDNSTATGNFNGASTPTGATLAEANAAFVPRLPRYGRLTHDQDRLGLTGALQWRVNDANLFNLDVLYSDFNAKRDENFLEAISFSRTNAQGGKPQTLVRNAVIAPNGTMVYGLFDDVDIRAESRHDELETKFGSYTLSGSHDIGERWTLSELVGYSKSEFTNPIQTTITLDRRNSDGYSWDFRNDDRLPQLNYGFDVNDPSSWTFQNAAAGQGDGQSEIRLRPQGVDNVFKTGQIDLQFKATDSLSFKGGVNYKKYTFDSFEARRASETSVPALPAGTTLADLTQQITGVGDGIIPGGTPTSWLIPNLDAFVRTFDIYSNSGTFALGSITNSSARGNNRSVDEEDRGAYVQMNFNTEVLGLPLRGDLGLRYVKTKQSSQGYLPVAGVTSVTVDHEYSDTLPSLNLVAEVTPDLLVRIGAAKVMARPPLGSVTPGGAIGLVGNLTVTSGNPELDPTRATAYDLGVEWYFDQGALLSAAVFYKDIKTFTQTLVEQQTYISSGLPLSLLEGTTLTGNEVFSFTRPVNTEGGPLKGLEINYQQPLRFLPGAFSNLGVLLNYTYVDSKIDYRTSSAPNTPTVENDLTGLSKNAYNGTLYYEDERFSIRASAAYRDRYLTAVPAANAPTIQDAEGTNKALNVDMSASYNINDHLTVTLEGLNLTDEFNDQFIDTQTDRVVVYTHTGRQYFFGARYKF
ncbi:MAG TPA: TonB-dependent receptor [Steroidobacteraceae bacterium]|jgi:TonB-dependent receptor